MSADPRMLDELRRLRARVPQLTGALVTGLDGCVLAQDTPGADPDAMASLIGTAHGAAVKLADATGQGEFRELLVRGVYGFVATYAAGDAAVLTLLAQDRVNTGRLLLEGRRAAARIGGLGDIRGTPAHRAGPAGEPKETAETAETTEAKETKETKETKESRAPKAAAPAARTGAAPAARTAAARTRTPRATRTTTTTNNNARTTTES